jgi:hypothetical protein
MFLQFFTILLKQSLIIILKEYESYEIKKNGKAGFE